MKFVILAISLAFSMTAFAAAKNAPASKNVFSSTEIVGSANESVHFMTNLMGLSDGKTNVQANFFGMPQLALSVNYTEGSEKTEPLKKTTAIPKVSVTTSQFGVGAAYYVWPVSHRWNAMINPSLVTERKTDPIDVDNSVGFGLKADGMLRFSNFTANLGAQLTSVSGSSNTLFDASVGYLF